MSNLLPDLQNLTVDARLKLIEELWDSIRDTPESIPMTDGQRAELDRRLDALDRDGAGGIAWSEVLDRIRDRHQ